MNYSFENPPDPKPGDEWQTPPEIIAMVREVLGEIDCDPASNFEAQQTINAKRWSRVESNGLTTEWHGAVFLNPPYSYPLIQLFIDKLILEYSRHHTHEAILLVNACTDTKWFQKLVDLGLSFCLTRGRVSFLRDGKPVRGNRCGQAVFYLGDNVERFADVFGRLGCVVGI